MKNILSILFCVISICYASQVEAQTNHTAWNALLSTYVSSTGKVNYPGFKSDEGKLDSYLSSIANSIISSDKNEALAQWINAYNAYTIKLIISNWPVSSIKDVSAKVGASTPWDYNFAVVAGKSYTLNQIEHEVIRKQFNEPRIHFAVNCAAKSCPPLLNEAFLGSKLEQQLSKQTKLFINNSAFNILSPDAIKLSKIFEWFKDDFTRNGSLITFINAYSNTSVSKSATLSYLEYDWALNN